MSSNNELKAVFASGDKKAITRVHHALYRHFIPIIPNKLVNKDETFYILVKPSNYSSALIAGHEYMVKNNIFSVYEPYRKDFNVNEKERKDV